MHFRTPEENAANVLQFARHVFALRGYIPAGLPPEVVRRLEARNRRRGLATRVVGLTREQARSMSGFVAGYLSETQDCPTAAKRRELADVSANAAVMVAQNIRNAGPGNLDTETAEALFTLLCFVNGHELGLTPPEPYLAEECRAEVFAGLADEELDRGADRVAAALRRMYAMRSILQSVLAILWV